MNFKSKLREVDLFKKLFKTPRGGGGLLLFVLKGLLQYVAVWDQRTGWP